MKRIGLICVTLLAGLSLSACNNLASQQSHKSSSSSSFTKVVKKHHSSHKKSSSQTKTSSLSSSSNFNSTAVSQAQSTSSSTTTSSANSKQVNKADPSTWDNIPYKGYPSYNAYLEANGGDPEIQAETASMQHTENVKKGIENADGSETQNFQNWYNDEQNAWSAGNDHFPEYDQNTQW